ncbi:MFS transporter [Microlunatus parietis]|uniref:FSR family fosmidomycin resistance protein-like MFS transporter n=1 Tax=Microlunatus parietis TaxID=682979 RepID=A0A7Y9I9L0_9ACTN|nr:MFS transporter [Microlunatus parietis]NYE72717.1 FSR family fosmidomycin resistance protein-like MFS transporter [Microlunatus parietis]
MHQPRPARHRLTALLLAVGHGGVDCYQGMVAALVPVFVLERGYSLPAAGGLVFAASLTSSVVQPLFGLLGDRRPARWIVPVSVLVTGAGIGALGLVGEPWLVFLLVALSGIGIAAFHPAAARLARELSGGDHVQMSWFALGGNIGFAVAPFLVAGTVGALGLAASPLLIMPAAVALIMVLGCLRTHRAATSGTPLTRTAASLAAEDRRSFGRLTVAIMARSIIFVGLGSFIALYAQQDPALGPAGGTGALFVLYLGGAFGTVLGGRLARRWPRTRILRWSYLLTAPAMVGLVLAPGAIRLIFVAVVSFLLYVPFSLHLTLAQDYLPRHVGTASGVTLGLAVSVGGLASPALGVLAEQIGLTGALLSLIIVAGLAWLALRRLPEPQPLTSPLGQGTS